MRIKAILNINFPLKFNIITSNKSLNAMLKAFNDLAEKLFFQFLSLKKSLSYETCRRTMDLGGCGRYTDSVG